MQGHWRYTIGFLLVTTALLGAASSQAAERVEDDNGNAKVECDAFTLEELAPGMNYTEVKDLLRARSPRPRLAGKHRRHGATSGWQTVHTWPVEAGTIEVWYEGKVVNRKMNPTAVRVRLLVRENEVSPEALWQSVFDRFGPMSTWEREDCNIKVAVGLERDQPYTALTLLSWEPASKKAQD